MLRLQESGLCILDAGQLPLCCAASHQPCAKVKDWLQTGRQSCPSRQHQAEAAGSSTHGQEPAAASSSSKQQRQPAIGSNRWEHLATSASSSSNRQLLPTCSSNSDQALPHGNHLREAAGLKHGWHKEHVAACRSERLSASVQAVVAWASTHEQSRHQRHYFWCTLTDYELQSKQLHGHLDAEVLCQTQVAKIQHTLCV